MFWLQFSIEFCSHLSYSEPCGRRFFKKLPVYPLYPSGWILDKEIKNIHVCNILLQNVDSYSVEGLVFITCRDPSFCLEVLSEHLPAHIFKLRSRGAMYFWVCGRALGPEVPCVFDYVAQPFLSHPFLLLAEGDFEIFRLLSHPSFLWHGDDL